MPASKAGILKLLLSVWVIFHVTVMVIMPNGLSYPGRVLAHLIYPYAAVVGLNVSWNFFSPDPAHTMYLRFTVYDENNWDKEPLVISMPEEQDRGVWDLGRRRDLYSMRYFLLDPRRFDAVLGPWLCRVHAPATVVRIEHVVDSIPSLDEAVLFQSRDLRDLSQQMGFSDRTYRCSQMNDEVGL